MVETGGPLPGFVEGDDLAGRQGSVQTEANPVHGVDQVIVHEQLKPGAQVQGFIDVCGLR